MKSLLVIASSVLLLSHCQHEDISENRMAIFQQQFEIALHETLTLKGSTQPDENNQLGEITFSHLNESRCPANANCIRQGAAVTTFSITSGPGAEPQTIRLFIGDFMANDPRNKRNLSADTAEVQLADKSRYRLILKNVSPYPGTGGGTPKATLLLERP